MLNPRLRIIQRWRKWTKQEWAIAAIGSFAVVFALSLIFDTRPLRPTTAVTSNGALVDLILIHSAKDRGALCLDGSLPGYHFQKGSGSGSRNWLLYVEGGGWCNTVASCSKRKTTSLGSSKYMEPRVSFQGMLSSEPSQNPDFYNWNKVKVRYCDGGSFAGRPESEFKNGTELFFRGQLIWEAVMDELSSMGMSNAKQAFLTGCSAGGLATIIHCDSFRELLPKDATVKCLADAGFFLDDGSSHARSFHIINVTPCQIGTYSPTYRWMHLLGKDVLGNYSMRSFYRDVISLQGLAKSLPKNCVSKMEPYKCIFPREIIKTSRTPLFLVQPVYDFWQIQHILVPDEADPQGHWRKCRLSLKYCNPSQSEVLNGYRNSMLKQLSDFKQKEDGGMFINSCFIHCQSYMASTWHSQTSPRVNNMTIAESVGDWYFDRGVVKQIDCAGYTCNPTCYNMDFTRF